MAIGLGHPAQQLPADGCGHEGTGRHRVAATRRYPLAGLLDAGFDAFEVIRLVARAGEDRAPDLFAAFITAAGTAVEGRNALGDAPSLPPATAPPPAITMSSTAAPARSPTNLPRSPRSWPSA